MLVGCVQSRGQAGPGSANYVGPGTMCDQSSGTWTQGGGTLHCSGVVLLLATCKHIIVEIGKTLDHKQKKIKKTFSFLKKG